MARCVVDGLAYLHSKRVAHRDLKPDNILLFGDALIVAKISDFGTSKVLQTMLTNTSMAGTPKYTAPELLEEGSHYGASADVFSLSMVLYELFTGKDPFPKCSTIVQVISAMMRNVRPEIPATFPRPLGDLVKRGWSTNPTDRPEAGAFQEALRSSFPQVAPKKPTTSDRRVNINITAAGRAAEVAVSAPSVPLISMGWSGPEACDELDSKAKRAAMVASLRESDKKTMFTGSVLKAMEAVPRHLFIEPSRYTGSSRQQLVDTAYAHNRAMGATATSNESSPEIIGVQLSLVKLEPGASVLIVGGKGGYIVSLVAQITGVNGTVVTVTSQGRRNIQIGIRRTSLMHIGYLRQVQYLSNINNTCDSYDTYTGVLCGRG